MMHTPCYGKEVDASFHISYKKLCYFNYSVIIRKPLRVLYSCGDLGSYVRFRNNFEVVFYRIWLNPRSAFSCNEVESSMFRSIISNIFQLFLL